MKCVADNDGGSEETMGWVSWRCLIEDVCWNGLIDKWLGLVLMVIEIEQEMAGGGFLVFIYF